MTAPIIPLSALKDGETDMRVTGLLFYNLSCSLRENFNSLISLHEELYGNCLMSIKMNEFKLVFSHTDWLSWPLSASTILYPSYSMWSCWPFVFYTQKKSCRQLTPKKKKKNWSLVAYDYYFLLVRFLGKNDTRERKKRDVIHFLQFFKLALMHSFLRFRLSHAVCHCGKSSRTSCHFYTCE